MINLTPRSLTFLLLIIALMGWTIGVLTGYYLAV